MSMSLSIAVRGGPESDDVDPFNRAHCSRAESTIPCRAERGEEASVVSPPVFTADARPAHSHVAALGARPSAARAQ